MGEEQSELQIPEDPSDKRGGIDASAGTFVGHVLATVLIVVVVGMLLYFLWSILRILMLIFAGTLIAVLLRGLSVRVARLTHLRPGFALILVCLGLGGVMFGFGAMIAPEVSEQAGAISKEVPRAIGQLHDQISQYEWGRILLDQIPENPVELIPTDVSFWAQFGGIVSTTLGGVVDFLVVVVIGVYLAINPGMYLRGFVRLFPLDKRARVEEVLDALGSQLNWWLVARLLTMIAVGVLTAIGLWILGMPNVLTLALIAGILEFIPFVGPILSAIPAILLALLVSPQLALYVAIFYWIVQNLENYLIVPVVHQRIVSLPPALVIIAELVMTLMAGFLGLLLATPLLVVAGVLLKMVYIEGILGEPRSEEHDEHEEGQKRHFWNRRPRARRAPRPSEA